MLKLKAALFGLAVVFLGIGLDMLLPLLFEHSWKAELISDVLTGVVAGFLMFRYMLYRARLSQGRTLQIADLNHHIRNALDALVLSHYTADDVQRLQILRDASNRIQSALKEFTNEERQLMDSLSASGAALSRTDHEESRGDRAPCLKPESPHRESQP